jgi:hypothetical protein
MYWNCTRTIEQYFLMINFLASVGHFAIKFENNNVDLVLKFASSYTFQTYLRKITELLKKKIYFRNIIN